MCLALEVAGLNFPSHVVMALILSLLGVVLNISTDQMPGKIAS